MKSSSLRWLFLISFISLLNHLDRNLLSSLAPLIQSEWNFSDAQLGGLIALATLARTSISLPAGYLSDRYGRLGMIRISTTLWIFFVVFTSQARQWSSFLLSRLGVSLADGSNGPADLALVGDLFPKGHLGRAIGVYNLSVPVGSSLGFVLGGLIGEYFGWRWAFSLTAGIGLAAIVTLWLWKFPLQQKRGNLITTPSEENRLSTLTSLLKWPLSGIYLGGALGVFSASGLAFWLPTWLARQHHLSLAQAGSVTGFLVLIAVGLGYISGGWLSDRWEAKQKTSATTTQSRLGIAVLGLWLAIPFGIVGLFSSNLVVSLGCILLGAFLLTIPVSPILALIEETVPTEWKATAISIFGITTQVFGAVPSPFFVGLLSEQAGLSVALLLPLGIGGMGGTLLALCYRSARTL